MHCYVFELKSIQSYIFNSTKLRDVISASERLANLIDEPTETTQNASVLLDVLTQLHIEHNLADSDATLSDSGFYFVRANGGSIQILTQNNLEQLQKFRALWTLTVTQLFPGMTYVDHIESQDHVQKPVVLIKNTLDTLRGKRNLAHPMRPMPTAAVKAHAPTGETIIQPEVRLYRRKDSVDAAMLNHEIAYENDFANLKNKFTDNPDISFARQEEAITGDAQAGDRKIALVHMDGNAFGVILKEVQAQLAHCTDIQTFASAFRAFSSTIAHSTISAAQEATKAVQNALHEQKGLASIELLSALPMRPIVCGGDDVTVLLRYDLAIDFVQAFSKAFYVSTAKNLKQVNKSHFQNKLTKLQLSASGGIVYQRDNAPFMASNQLVEALASQAKQATKDLATLFTENEQQTPPATVSYCQLQSGFAGDLSQLIEQTQQLTMPNQAPIQCAATSFILASDEDAPASAKKLAQYKAKQNKQSEHSATNSSDNLLSVYELNEVLAFITSIKEGNCYGKSLNMSKFRQMLTELSMQRLMSANKILTRALPSGKNANTALTDKFNELYGNDATSVEHAWMVQNGEHAYSILIDLVNLHSLYTTPKFDKKTDPNLHNVVGGN